MADRQNSVIHLLSYPDPHRIKERVMMNKKRFKISLFCVLAGILMLPAGSFAFKSITRDQMIYDAIEFCPRELQTYLLENIEIVSAGNHFAERHQRRSYTIDPYETEVIYNHLVKDLKEGKYDEFNTAHAFGVVACFIAETISPDNYRTPQHLIPDNVSYDGYQQVGDIKSHITSLIKNYRIPCRQKMNKRISEVLYNVAVNEIVDYWVSAWQKSGYQAGMFANAGKKISHQNLVLNPKSVGIRPEL